MNGERNSRKFGDDRVVQEINKLISLNDEDTKRNNVILKTVLQDVIDAMKEADDFFRNHFQNIMFVGSFYKGTKVGKPEEFDLDLIIQLPMKYDLVKFERDLPGYTRLKVGKECFSPTWQNHSKLLSKWVTEDGYLNQDEFRQWMERLFTTTTPKLAAKEYKLKVKKSGPAFTLLVDYPDSMEMSVDLVPVLEFKTQPPILGDFTEASWLAVPKPLKKPQEKPHIYWRMSFYNFERNMLKSHGYLKPVIRQVKKLRDRWDWKVIASYHIETLFMHEQCAIDAAKDSRKGNSTELFLRMLNRLKAACEKKIILNYWDKNDNMIDAVKPAQLASIIGLLGKAIKSIEKDPLTMAAYVLTAEELCSISPALETIRKSRDGGKSIESPTTKVNGVEKQLQSQLSNSTTSSNSSATSVVGNLFMAKQTYLTGDNRETLAPVTPITETRKASIAPKTEAPKAAESITDGKKCEQLAQILDTLKSIHSEMADTKDAVNLLTRRVGIVEDKIDAILSRSNGSNDNQLFFGTSSIGSSPINSRILRQDNNNF